MLLRWTTEQRRRTVDLNPCLCAGKANTELESEEPPPWLAKNAAYAPSIPDSVDSQYRLAVASNGSDRSGRAKIDHTMLMHNADLKPPPTDSTRCIADFHHDGGSLQKAPAKASRSSAHPSLTEPVPLHVDDEVENQEEFVDLEFSRVLGSVIDRCYLLCHDFEWQAWQTRAAIGTKGSRVYSRTQARSIAQSIDMDGKDTAAETTLVLELEVLQGALDCDRDGELRLACTVRLPSLRSVYTLLDFIALSRMAHAREEAAASHMGGSRLPSTAPSHQRLAPSSAHGSSPAPFFGDDGSASSSATLEREEPETPRGKRASSVHDDSGALGGDDQGAHVQAGDVHSAYSVRQLAMSENAWMLDDFEELLVRRKYSALASMLPCACGCWRRSASCCCCVLRGGPRVRNGNAVTANKGAS
jgi:hypothetical protein